MGKPKAPAAPDPKETAAAQTGTNVSTAIANATLGNVNQYGPDGSVTYSQTGTRSVTDPTTGTTYDVPQYSQYTTLSPEQAAIKAQTDAASGNLAGIAENQSAFLKDYLAKPVDLNNSETEARLMELGRSRLDPIVAQREEDLRTRLANQGIKAGSDAYSRELNTFNQGTNDAYNQLLLNGRQQAVQEALTERNQPLNEISALLSGSQVGVPQFGAATNPQSIPTVDYAGLVQDNYNQKLGIYNQQQAQRNSLLGGLFGLGAAGIMASDRRVKKDIEKVGKLDDLNLYRYRYKGESPKAPKHTGVMAQEVQRKDPGSVVEVGGIKHVNYGRLFDLGRGEAA